VDFPDDVFKKPVGENPMADDLDLDLDFPIPPEDVESVSAVKDDFDYDVAFKMAFCGVGQGGSRIAEAFHKLGYGRVCALNLTSADLSKIDLPDKHKLDLGHNTGAGKDPQAAAEALEDKDEDIYDLLKRSWGNEVDYAMICFGSGGGTGAGGYKKVAEIAKRFLTETKRPVRVGIMPATPRLAEGWKPCRITVDVFEDLKKESYSPVIVMDNQKVHDLYANARLSSKKFWAVANTSTAKYLHMFNRLAAADSELTTFDRADFARLLDSGVVAFGAQKIAEYQDEADISHAIRQQLRGNILAAVDLTKGKQAGLIFVIGEDIIDDVPQANLDHGFEMLTRILNPASTIYQGVYQASGSDLMALTMVGELEWPEERLQEIAKKADR
jgi:cell division GTPase FtsZ